MRLTGVDPSCPNPWRRCRHKSLTDRLKPSDECCQNCVSWTDTSTALLCGETERFSACSVEQNLTTTCSCAIWQNEANFSQFIQYLTNTNSKQPASKVIVLVSINSSRLRRRFFDCRSAMDPARC